MVDAALTAQAPLAVSYVAKLRAGAKDLSPAHLLKQLERQLLAATTSSGAAVGGAAVAPRGRDRCGLGPDAGRDRSVPASFSLLHPGRRRGPSGASSRGRTPRTLVLAVLIGNGAEKAIHKVAERTGTLGTAHAGCDPRRIDRSRSTSTSVATSLQNTAQNRASSFLEKSFRSVSVPSSAAGRTSSLDSTIIEASRRAFGKPRTAFAPAEERFEAPNDYVSDDPLEPGFYQTRNLTWCLGHRPS